MYYKKIVKIIRDHLFTLINKQTKTNNCHQQTSKKYGGIIFSITKEAPVQQTYQLSSN